MKVFSCILLLCAFCLSNVVMSQTTEVKKTDVNKDVDLIKVYEQYVEDGYGTAAVYKKLADGYYFKSDYTTAKKWFEELFKAAPALSKEYKNRYIQTLRALDIDPANNRYLKPTN